MDLNCKVKGWEKKYIFYQRRFQSNDITRHKEVLFKTIKG